MIKSTLVTCTLLCYVSLVAAVTQVAIESDSRYVSPVSISHGYSIQRITPRSEDIELVFAIKQQNLKELEKIFHAVSDPSNKKYSPVLLER